MLSMLALGCAPLVAQSPGFSVELASLDIEELMNIRITSVSRRDERLSGAPASAFIITAEDIRRSGATSLPEILRMAPNLQVARVNAYEYAITSRGFNNRVGNKLLVLLDGRTIYTPLFSGVFWEMQDTNLDDIERIEVISGPGGTIWGANAVNGVINIITAHTADTQATVLSGGAGSFERHASARTGGGSGPLTWRAYAKANEWDSTWDSQRAAYGVDQWRREQLGFRMDWAGTDQQLIVQGDTMQGRSQHRGFVGTYELPPVEVHSSNLQARWTRELDGGSSVSVQGYVVHSEREERILFSPESTITDLEAQHHFTFAAGFDHEVVWGGGYRHAHDKVGPGAVTNYLPSSRDLSWENLFIQDEIALSDTFSLTPGLKLEWNDYTGMEQLPSVRAAWELSEGHNLWAGWSRTVRAPSRLDRDVYFPATEPFIIAGGPNFVAEVAKVGELGYRSQPLADLSYSVTLYHYDWEKLRSGTPLPLPVYLVNNIAGESWGVEGWGTWQVASGWRLRAGFNTLEKDLAFNSGTSDTVGVANPTLHNDPDYQLMLRSSHDLSNGVQMDLQLRRIAALEVEPVPAYAEMDLRLGWSPVDNVELSLTGTNLLHSRHAEYGPANNRSEINRSVLLGFRWTL